MRILITTASRHGGTREIGIRLGSVMRAGLLHRNNLSEVDVRDVREVDAVAEYDAVILGSAVYLGRWLRSARRLAEREFSELETRPVWLFSSGPIGDRGHGAPETKLGTASWVVEHKVFGGRLDRSMLSWQERLIVSMIKAPDADYRSFDDIDAWADGICTTLVALDRSPTTPA